MDVLSSATKKFSNQRKSFQTNEKKYREKSEFASEKKQGKIVAKLLLTEVTVCYKPYCVYVHICKTKKAFEARLRDGRPKFRQGCAIDGRPKFRNAKKFSKQQKKFVTRRKERKGKERKGKVEELQRSFANCLRRSAVKKKPKSYSGRLLTAR